MVDLGAVLYISTCPVAQSTLLTLGVRRRLRLRSFAGGYSKASARDPGSELGLEGRLGADEGNARRSQREISDK